jgi:hypothetical protein
MFSRESDMSRLGKWFSASVTNAHTIVKLALLILMMGRFAAFGLTDDRLTVLDLHTCQYSDQVYNSDASLEREKAPTHLRLMTSRYVQIVQAARGRNCTGTATVAFNGHNYMQAGRGDDPGVAELIPIISSLTGASLAETFDLTALAVVSLGIVIGYAGFWRLYPTRRVRWAGIAIFLSLGLVEATVADVYIFQVSPLMAGIPWVLYFGLTRRPFALNLSAIVLAFCCSWCSFVRTGTTVICLAFLFTVVAGRHRVQRVFLPLLLIIFACVPCVLFERYLVAHRGAVLGRLGETATAVNSHALWHTIYTGLGFVSNSQVPEFDDSVAINKVWSIDPTAPYLSAQYELILRREVFSIAKHKPMLLVENLAVKTGALALLALVLLFPARRLLFAEREVLWLDAAFVLAIGVSAMNAILAVPRPRYLLTFFCLTCLYSSIKVCGALSMDASNPHPPGR